MNVFYFRVELLQNPFGTVKYRKLVPLLLPLEQHLHIITKANEIRGVYNRVIK